MANRKMPAIRDLIARKKKVSREELLKSINDNCLSIKMFMKQMDVKLGQFVRQAREAERERDFQKLDYARNNIRIVATQKRTAEVMYNSLSQARDQVELKQMIQSFTCDLGALNDVCRKLDLKVDSRQVAREYREVMSSIQDTNQQFDLFTSSMIDGMMLEGGLGNEITDQEIDALIAGGMGSRRGNEGAGRPDGIRARHERVTDDLGDLRSRLNNL